VFFRKREEVAPAEPLDAWRSTQELVTARGVRQLLEVALTHAITLVPAASKGWVVLRDHTSRIAATKGYGSEWLGLELVGPWHDGQPRISTNIVGDFFQPNVPEVRAKLGSQGLREAKAALVVPLRNRTEVRGALIVDAYGSDGFSPANLEAVARWCQVVTPTLEMVSQLSRYRTLAWGLTLAFVEAIEARDFAQLGHAQRVTSYALAVAREKSFSQGEQNELWFAAMLHDIGKLVQDGLEEAEYASLGFNLLSNVTELEAARQAIRHQHEHWDGSGKPDGLKGQAIPLFSRLIAVANSYDYYTSERGEELEPRQALERLKTMAGVMLDPSLIPLLEAVLSHKKATAEMKPEGLFPT
jgi:HD-GYP domain-containing protein (c-di-GMP phosphodiesterase class II)